MNWPHRFAARTQLMRRSSVRDLLAAAARPDIISFAGGLPDPAFFPVDALREATGHILSRNPAEALQYGETAGLLPLREWIAHQHSCPARAVHPDEVVITTGAQQALDLLGRVFLDPGDAVLVENPTYLALLGAWRPHGVRFLPLRLSGSPENPVHAEPTPDSPPKLAYVIPNFQNPSGTSLSLAQRRELLSFCRRHRIGLVEDDPYGELRDHDPAPPSLLHLDAAESRVTPSGGCVIHCGTFSKTLAPGLRVGWVIAPPPVAEKLVLAKQSTDLHTSTLSQHLVLELLRGGFPETVLPAARAAYRERRLALLDALERHLPDGSTWTRPDGGMFLFVTLPTRFDTHAILPRALAEGVAYVPGAAFHLDDSGRHTLRLNFTLASPDRIREGVRRLARVLC